VNDDKHDDDPDDRVVLIRKRDPNAPQDANAGKLPPDHFETCNAVYDSIAPMLDRQTLDIQLDVACMMFATALARVQGDRVGVRRVRRAVVQMKVGQIHDMTRHAEGVLFGNGRRTRRPRR